MSSAEQVFAVPELLDRIAAYLPVLDIIRIVRVHSFCYRNVRSSAFIKRKLYYLPPDEDPGEEDDVVDVEDEQEVDDNALNGGPGAVMNAQIAARAAMFRRRLQPEHPPWECAIDLRKLNPVLDRIFPSSSIMNLSNNMAVLTTGTHIRPTKLHGLPKKVRPTWKAMLFTSQTCSRIHITPAALYSSPTTFQPTGPYRRQIDPEEANEPPPTISHSFSDLDWTPRGWRMDHHAHRKLTLALEAIGETAPPRWLPGSITQEHWTEYLAKRRNELCDGWIWGQSLEEFGITGAGAGFGGGLKRSPNYGYFEETIEAEDGLIRCGQLAREIEAAGWCWWILRIEP